MTAPKLTYWFSWALRRLPANLLYPFYRLARRLVPEDSVPILYYHRVNPHSRDAVRPEAFERQMEWLAREGFTFKTLGGYLTGLRTDKAKTVVLTFDDGYEDNYIFAFPILARYHAPATIFVATSYIGAINPHPHFDAAGRPEGAQMLSWEQLTELSAAGIEIASHTVAHERLTEMADEELECELVVSKRVLEEKLGRSVTYLSYPYGQYNPRVINAARGAGYKGACTTRFGRHNRRTPDFEIRRLYVSASEANPIDLDKRISGAYDIPMTVQYHLRKAGAHPGWLLR